MNSKEYVIIDNKTKEFRLFRDKDQVLDFLKNAPHDDFSVVVMKSNKPRIVSIRR